MNKTTNDNISINGFFNFVEFDNTADEEIAYGGQIYDAIDGILSEYSCFEFRCTEVVRLKGGIQLDIEIKLNSSFQDAEVEMTIRCYKGVVLINRYEDVYDPFSEALFWSTMFFGKRSYS